MASTFRFVWDGNVLLHETFKKDNSENTELTTWVFEGFVPTAKLVNGKAYSIISDHLGTPILAVDSEGNEVWNRQLDIYGRVKREIKASSLGEDVRPFIPFLYQGQYYDFETKLAYNRFRYYSPETGAYISQDPIGLWGGINLYSYTHDINSWIDKFGLRDFKTVNFKGSEDLFPNEKAIIKIPMQGNRDDDFEEAFKRSGINPEDAKDYTWHHLDDFNPSDGTCTMQLVKTSAHIESLPHQGAVKQFTEHFGIKNKMYGSYEAKKLAFDAGWREKKPKKYNTKKKNCNGK